jgi:hypothetical protein
MALKFKIHAGLSIEHLSISGMRNMVQPAKHTKVRKLTKTFQPAKHAKEPSTPRTVLKDCYVSLLLKKAWRPWLLGELGGLKRLGVLPYFGAPGENLFNIYQNKACYLSRTSFPTGAGIGLAAGAL